MTAAAGHDGDRVNGITRNLCEGQRGDAPPQGSEQWQSPRGGSRAFWLVEQTWLTLLSVDSEDERVAFYP